MIRKTYYKIVLETTNDTITYMYTFEMSSILPPDPFLVAGYKREIVIHQLILSPTYQIEGLITI